MAHIERGCCPGGPVETHRRIFAAVCSSNLLLGGHGGLPSKHRIGSTTAANADQCGGIMIHDFLPRCVQRSFQSWDSAVPDNHDGDDDYRAAVRKKLWRVLHALEPEHKVDRLLVNWLAAPLDHLWMAIQRLDAQGHVIRTLSFPDTCPFVKAVEQYTRIIFAPMDEGELKSLIFHLELQIEMGYLGDVDFDVVTDNIRTLGCSIACQITWRAIWLFGGKPYMAVLIVDARLSPAEQLDVCRRIHGSNPCDLDPWFLRKALSDPHNHI